MNETEMLDYIKKYDLKKMFKCYTSTKYILNISD